MEEQRVLEVAISINNSSGAPPEAGSISIEGCKIWLFSIKMTSIFLSGPYGKLNLPRNLAIKVSIFTVLEIRNRHCSSTCRGHVLLGSGKSSSGGDSNIGNIEPASSSSDLLPRDT
ncbi:protein phosphatase inhibitor [Corchorus olitorius]|uniref:Protein phosphatase inhibitor n=1 Tax=Corchorus olitorius TaxID=93759 RepID=A0A1R3HIB4_9ROSI|nr:protein phosphatase inhibitor [Corchorus olitorius]